jgi:hypothetical protein
MRNASLPEEPVALVCVTAGAGNHSAALRRRRATTAAVIARRRRILDDHPSPPRHGHPAVDFSLLTFHGHVVSVTAAVAGGGGASSSTTTADAIIAAAAAAAAGLGVVLVCHRGVDVDPCQQDRRHGGAGLRVAGGFFFPRRGGGRRRRGRRRIRDGYGGLTVRAVHSRGWLIVSSCKHGFGYICTEMLVFSLRIFINK